MPLTVLKFASGTPLLPRAYLDTNFVIYTRDAASTKYHAASACLAELLRQHVQLNVSALMFDELWWAYLRKSFQLLTGNDLTAAAYKSSPQIVRTHWPAVDAVMRAIQAWGGFTELPTPTGVVAVAEGLMQMNALLPRDAFHLAITLHHGIESFVTADSDFDTLILPPTTNLTLIKI